MPRSPTFPWTSSDLQKRVKVAVRDYWTRRGGQSERQRLAGNTDTGTRGEVRGGLHLTAFSELVCEVVRSAGFNDTELRFKSGVELPGYYRPQKKWDVVVIRGNRLCAALELKSQVRSFGNNFNNRTEEAIGSSADFWLAYREGAMGAHQPWLGYFLFVEEAPQSTAIVSLKKAVFAPMPIFNRTSYIQRYGILCQRLVLERNYNAACFIVAPRSVSGAFREPLRDLQIGTFLKSLFGHLVGIV